MTNSKEMALEGEDLSYTEKVGKRLRALRKQKRLSLQEVEAQSKQEFKASVLGAYERGERAISVPRLQRLAAFYRMPVDQLLPRLDAKSVVEVIDLDGQNAPPATQESVTIDLHRVADATDKLESQRLNNFLQALQLQRGDFNGRMLTIRRDDLLALGVILDTNPDKASSRLEELGLLLDA